MLYFCKCWEIDEEHKVFKHRQNEINTIFTYILDW
jgi:hypothetical protein